jgi:5-methylcytosine-specific restriction endonuclease McrA
MPKRIPTYRPEGSAPAAVRKRYDNSPARAADKRFYASAAWRSLRADHLARHPLCVMCERAGRYRPASHVDHIEPRKRRPDLALDGGNLQGLCQPCHNAKRAEE